MSNETTYDRFMKYVVIGKCWEWTGGKDGSGYGKFQAFGKKYGAHRFSYMLFIGEIPDGMCVCHSCDNPSCVKPGHFWLGTHKDNMDDRDMKGKSAKTESHKMKISIAMKGNQNRNRSNHECPFIQHNPD